MMQRSIYVGYVQVTTRLFHNVKADKGLWHLSQVIGVCSIHNMILQLLLLNPFPFLKYIQNLKPQHDVTLKEHFSHVTLLSDLDTSNLYGYSDYLSSNHAALNVSRKP